MILGLPGMGKTTGLINICVQLLRQEITPIVFSYHQDIDEKPAARLETPPLAVKYAGLGFNPMEVVGEGPLAYLDNAGMLRDIFAAIFPDLGDVQLGRLRHALKQSYLDCGWGPGQCGGTPAFGAFLDLLRADPKPDKGLLTRLDELDDYGLFGTGAGAPTLLHERQLALIECHGTQNEHLQRAFATLVLHNLYQGMFRRGPQQRITHAVIFDEAHKAARLKLLANYTRRPGSGCWQSHRSQLRRVRAQRLDRHPGMVRGKGVPEVGDRLVAEIFQRVEALADHSEIGRIVPEFDQPFLRELILERAVHHEEHEAHEEEHEEEHEEKQRPLTWAIRPSCSPGGCATKLHYPFEPLRVLRCVRRSLANLAI